MASSSTRSSPTSPRPATPTASSPTCSGRDPIGPLSPRTPERRPAQRSPPVPSPSAHWKATRRRADRAPPPPRPPSPRSAPWHRPARTRTPPHPPTPARPPPPPNDSAARGDRLCAYGENAVVTLSDKKQKKRNN